jgi:hypothetical protein
VIKGKALIIIEKLDSKWVPFDVSVHVQSGGRDGYYEEETWSCLSTDSLPCPDAAYKLKVGEKIWVSVVYVIEHRVDYWGEWDVKLRYLKQRVIKRRRLK